MENLKHLDIIKADMKTNFLDGHKLNGYFLVDKNRKLHLLNKNDYYEIYGLGKNGTYIENTIKVYNTNDYEKELNEVENIEILYRNADEELIEKIQSSEGKPFGNVFEDMLNNIFGGQ